MDTRQFVITANKAGGFICLGVDSRYQGWHTPVQGTLYKILHDIHVAGKIQHYHQDAGYVHRIREHAHERMLLPLHASALVYSLDQHVPFDLILDVRQPYDNRRWGKSYSITHERGKLIIQFTKTHDARDQDTLSGEEYHLFLVIEGDEDLHFKKIEEWIPCYYPIDEQRHSPPYDGSVFKAVQLVARRIILAVSDDKDAACALAERVTQQHLTLERLRKSYFQGMSPASANLSEHLVKFGRKKYVLPGYPWAFAPDMMAEAQCVRALLLDNQIEDVKFMLYDQLKQEIQAPWSMLGWHAFAWHSVFEFLSRNHRLPEYFSPDEIKEITARLESLHEKIQQHYLHEGLIHADDDPWMPDLPGPRLEHQALYACFLELLHKITGNNEYAEVRHRFLAGVRERFTIPVSSLSVRHATPNIFIAAYLCPHIYPEPLWEEAFEGALSELWLPWGGISTLSTTHPLFCSTHSGEVTTSHFHGDSWYWINNLTALALHRMNAKRFKKYIDAIHTASTKELLHSGALGHHAQMSSASHCRSEGCWSYAPSAALYIELMNELNHGHRKPY